MNNNVEFVIESLNHARILNSLYRNGVCVRKCKKELRRLYVTVNYKDENKVKKYFEEYGYNYKIIAQQGIKYVFQRFFNRYGLIAGIIISITLLILFSTFLLSIDINGLENVSIEEVNVILSEQSVKPYCFKNKINITNLQNDINSIEGVASVSVVLKGVKLLINVQEELPDGVIEDNNYEGLFAEYDAIITKVVVESGTALVKAGDTVKAGTMLIAPYYMLEEERIEPTSAKGKIYARHWIKEDINFATEKIEKIATGESKTVCELYFADILIGKASKCPYNIARENVNTVELSSIVPLVAIYHTYYEYTEMLVIHDYETEHLAKIYEKEREIEQNIPEDKRVMRKWNITKKLDKLYIISIYYELEGRIDVRLH